MDSIKILQINGGSTGSTGKIMFGIKKVAEPKGYEVVCAAPITETNKGKNDFYPIGTYYGRKFSVLLSRITGLNGCFALFATIKLIKFINKFSPTIIHLHNLHDSYLNLPIIFKYLKNKHIPIVWTLHDCWSFTGHCPHFIHEKCIKWKKGCFNCPRYKSYPVSYLDNSKILWHLKKKWFTGIRNLKIVTPSSWLASLVKQSFLKEYETLVINNGINVDLFKRIKSDFATQKGLIGKKIILGVSYVWDNKKGLDVFVELSKRLPDDYQIVLVGTSDEVDLKLPKKIVSIHRTENQQELVGIYSVASVFVNPTREDNFPTVNIEAISCGTPIVTFRTGGSSEMINDLCGIAVECDDIDSMEKEIIKICELSQFNSELVSEQALCFDEKEKYKEYVFLYESIKSQTSGC